MRSARNPVRAVVPATSANLGPGFDTLGLAVGLHDVVEAQATSGGLEVSVTGEGADAVSRDENHLVIRAMRATFDMLGTAPAGLAVTCTNSIPHGRGLGSSAAAIVAGVLAARELVPHGATRLNKDAVLGLAAGIEGHPDNVAACLLGGVTIAWTSNGLVRAVPMDVHHAVRPVVCVPTTSLSTDEARGLLPELVPHEEAARNAGRAALLVEALTRRPDLLLDATEDILHQQYREPAMPGTLTLVHELRTRGLAAVVSGAGPSVLVLATDDQVVTAPKAWEVRALAVDRLGAVVSQSADPDSNDTVASRHGA